MTAEGKEGEEGEEKKEEEEKRKCVGEWKKKGENQSGAACVCAAG